MRSRRPLDLNTISGGTPSLSRTAAKPFLSGAVVMPALKLFVPMVASSRVIHSTLPSSRVTP